MIDPTKVLVATPALDAKVECGYAGGLAASAMGHLFGNMTFLALVSHVALARNIIAHQFLASPFDWLVCIDSDIGFSPDDFRKLMDYPPYHETVNPEGTTLNEHGEALIVCAEYSKKQDTFEGVRFGLGFTRIHRSVFERLAKTVDGSGRGVVDQFQNRGQLMDDYFPSGAIEAGMWRGEDTGFFLLCRIAGIVPRVEQRTRLIHVGRKEYPYLPPVTGA